MPLLIHVSHARGLSVITATMQIMITPWHGNVFRIIVFFSLKNALEQAIEVPCSCDVAIMTIQFSFLAFIYLGLYSLSGKTSYRQISWSLEAARLDVAMVVSLCNLADTSAAALPRYLPNFRAIGKVWTRISQLRDFTRSCCKWVHVRMFSCKWISHMIYYDWNTDSANVND